MDSLADALRQRKHNVSRHAEYISWLTDVLEKLPDDIVKPEDTTSIGPSYEPAPYAFQVQENENDYGPHWLRT